MRNRNKDIAWNRIFESTPIYDQITKNGFYEISGKKIKELTKSEPRIICKHDSIEELPDIMRQHQFNLLAIQNGKYLVFKDPNFQGFLRLPELGKIRPKILKYKPNLFQTLTIDNLTTEKKAFKFAEANGLLNTHFKEELEEAASDRFYCSPFILKLPSADIPINSVQVEIDALYENLETRKIYVFELKNSASNSFNIRQLYYPFQHFKSKLNNAPVTSLVQFSNGIYYMTTIRFKNNYFDYDIESIKAYVFDNTKPKKISLEDILGQNLFTPYNTPTPQANNINTVIDLTNFISKEKLIDKDKITEYLGLDPRQTDYYINACIYLDLVTKKNKNYTTTEIGEQIANTVEFNERNNMVCKQILRTPLFNEIMVKFKKEGYFNEEFIVDRILHHDEKINSFVTANRRKSSILAWLNWVKKIIK